MTILGVYIPAVVFAVIVAVLAAIGITALVYLIFRVIGRRKAWARTLLRLTRVPFRITVLMGLLWLAAALYLQPDAGLTQIADFIFRALFTAAATWLLCALLYFLEEIAAARYRVDVRDNRVARRVRTQLRMLRRIGVVVIIVCALGAILLSVPGAATAGASLFASAGLLSVVAGLAAQSTLANVFAGMQLAFNNALRVDDVVIVETEWGKIEEITLTYVVVHIWDDRRMVLPSTYFTTNPFQNWTRHTSELLGSIDFDLDWRVDPARMRVELNRIVAATELWDERVVVLQVTDAVGGFVRVRVLVSAHDAPTLFDLRCLVRENLIDWITSANPEAIPVGRMEVREESSVARKPAPEHPVTEPVGLFSGTETAKARAAQFTESIGVQGPAAIGETGPPAAAAPNRPQAPVRASLGSGAPPLRHPRAPAHPDPAPTPRGIRRSTMNLTQPTNMTDNLASVPFTHERVLVSTGVRSGLMIIVAVHSTRLGQALGGARIWQYAGWTDAVADALRLSAAMTLKNAAAGLALGGGKAVIYLPLGTVLSDAEKRDAMLDLGDAVESLHGSYMTAEDVGSSAELMAIVAERTSHVCGLPTATGGVGEPADATAAGVYASILATLDALYGSREVTGRHLVISGLGQVGGRLARALAAAGATLTVTDINPDKRDLADEIGADWVPVAGAHRVQADLFVPCGLGGVLTTEVIGELNVLGVVGAANNQLAESTGAAELDARGILWAPDFVVNAGGVIFLYLASEPDADAAVIAARVDAIGDTVAQIFTDAQARGITTLAAAELLAAARLR